MSQTELKKRLKVLMTKAENQVCSDCPERQPRWASLIVPPPGSPQGALPIGAFCCLECSGSHRRLGVHISFVRSVNLDSWKEREVQAMENGGNKKVNAIFEAHLGGGMKPQTGADGRTRERFIRDKYERRKFFDGSVLQRFYEDESEEEESSSEEEENVRPRPQTNRAPSDAARKRAETRRSRLAATRSSVNSAQSKSINVKIKAADRPPRTSTQTRPVPAPAPPPPVPAPAPSPEVDLLDFGMPMSDPGPKPAPPSATPSPTLDLFANMSVSGNANGENSQAPVAGGNANNSSVNAQGGDGANNGASNPAQTPPQQRRMTSDQIMAMFNAPAQQQGMGMNGMVMMPNNNNMMMMGGGMMPRQSGGGNMSGSVNMGGMSTMQQQPQNLMMMQGAGSANLMMQQSQQGNMMMMMQQQNQMGSGMGNTNYQAGVYGNTMGGAMGGTGQGGGMGQHIGMMNQIHMGNPAMMMPMGGSAGQGTGAQQPQQQRASQNQFGGLGPGSFRS